MAYTVDKKNNRQFFDTNVVESAKLMSPSTLATASLTRTLDHGEIIRPRGKTPRCLKSWTWTRGYAKIVEPITSGKVIFVVKETWWAVQKLQFCCQNKWDENGQILFYIFRPIGARVKMCVATTRNCCFFSHLLSAEKLIAGNLPIHSLPLILHDSLNHISVCTRTSSCRSGDPRGISGIFVLADFSHYRKFPRFSFHTILLVAAGGVLRC